MKETKGQKSTQVALNLVEIFAQYVIFELKYPTKVNLGYPNTVK